MNEYAETTNDITTREFRLGSTAHAREAIRHLAGRYWLVVAAPIVALAIYGVWFDWRYIIITLCVVFLLFPTFALVGYNMILTSPSATRSLFSQRVTADARGNILVRYSAKPASDDTPQRPAFPPLEIPRHHISDVSHWSGNIVVKYFRNQTLIVPDSAFDTPGAAVDFYRRLDDAPTQ